MLKWAWGRDLRIGFKEKKFFVLKYSKDIDLYERNWHKSDIFVELTSNYGFIVKFHAFLSVKVWFWHAFFPAEFHKCFHTWQQNEIPAWYEGNHFENFLKVSSVKKLNDFLFFKGFYSLSDLLLKLLL